MRAALIDVSCIAHSVFHTMPYQQHIDHPTNVLYGLLVSCRKLEEDLAVDTIGFFFDSQKLLRRNLHPGYKGAREQRREMESEEIKEARVSMYHQINDFRNIHLPNMGCQNIFWQDGYEADDLIASAAKSNPDAKKLYIVSNDHDLQQLLEGNRVVIYKFSTKTYYREDDYVMENGIPVAQAASLIAWTGDPGDSVEGVHRVGPKTAAKWLQGKLPEDKRFLDNISLYNSNIKLVSLPFPGTEKCILKPNQKPNWDVLAQAIGAQKKEPPRGIKNHASRESVQA